MTSDVPGSAPTSPLPLDPQALAVLRSSAGRLTLRADDFARRLHQDVVALSPNVAVAMAGQGWPFCERIARATLWVALTDQPPPAAARVLSQIGMANWREGFPDSEYVSLAQALVRAIRDLMDNDWFTSMGSAWISCFQWMQPHLLVGARQAAEEYEAEASRSAPQQPGPGERTGASGRPGAPVQARGRGSDVAPFADAVDDEDDQVGYGQLMVSMTLNPRRPPDQQDPRAHRPE